GHALGATFRGFARRSRTFANQVRDRKFLVELACLSARSLLPFIKLFLVVSHSILAVEVPGFHRSVRRPQPPSSTSKAASPRPGHVRFSWPRTKQHPQPSRYQQKFARRRDILQPQNSPSRALPLESPAT